MITARSARRIIQAVDRVPDGDVPGRHDRRPGPTARYATVLLAVVDADGAAGVTPAGSVVFRRNGRVIGRAPLVNGTATLVLPQRFKARGHFVAQFQGGKKFAASGSAVLVLSA